MKNINITLSDTNYTEQAVTGINLDRDQFELFRALIQKIEGGLYAEDSAYISIDGLLGDTIKLRITEYENSV
ncbi:hypothetical protein ACFL9U_17415 [Thermodesulfobacteriota bacterium]